MNSMEYLSRVESLIGSEALLRVRQARVIIFGVGGVGSWAAEALVRSGVRRLTIVDCDVVAPSNVNRQLMAMSSTLGQPKVEVLKARLMDIAPDAEIVAHQELYSPDSADTFTLDDYDYVLDCIDSIAHKALLIRRATASSAMFYSSMGAARKLDPTRVRVAEFWQVEGCPLAAALRKRFRRSKEFPSKKFRCVYSDELLSASGALMPVTATFGLTLASLVLQNLIRQ